MIDHEKIIVDFLVAGIIDIEDAGRRVDSIMMTKDAYNTIRMHEFIDQSLTELHDRFLGYPMYIMSGNTKYYIKYY